MAERSSTSSSKRAGGRPAAGLPWALLLALVLVGGVELVFRSVEHRTMISNMYGVAEYHAVRNYAEFEGPADVAFVGSSRTKEGIVVPAVREALAEAGLPGMRVSNYSCAGARADEVRAAVDHLLDRGRPQLLLLGVTTRMLLGEEPRLERSAIYWTRSQWQSRLAGDGDVWRVAPIVARNELGNASALVRFRNRPTGFFDDAWIAARQRQRGQSAFTLAEVLRGDVTPSSIAGAITRRQRDEGDVSLVNRPISDERVRGYVDRLLIDGEYVLGEHREAELRAVFERCRAEGVPVVAFEVPISHLLEAHLPPGTQAEFLRRMASLCDSQGVPFVRYEGPRGDELFAEQSHLNRGGAEILSRSLVENVILPHLQN